MMSVVNNASKFEDGAPSGGTYFKMKKLNYKNYQSISMIKKGSKRVNDSQEKALVTAFNEFKGVKDSVFYEKNLSSNPTIHNAVLKDRKRNRGDDDDIYNIPEAKTVKDNFSASGKANGRNFLQRLNL